MFNMGNFVVLKLLSWLVMHFLFIKVALGKIHHYTFVVELTPYTRLCRTKPILTVNGQFPGPTIYANKGDIVHVKTFNRSPTNITIHWHGVKQPRNPWSDGPEYITQCGIQPGRSFNYKIIFSSEEGTLWWHAHSEWDRATVHGAIIVYPPKFPYKEPYGEIPIILSEWWNKNVSEVLELGLQTGAEFNLSNAYTINGQPGDLYPCSRKDTFKVQVEQNQTYLLRIINAAMNYEHFFAVANHILTVVGTDGAYLKPFDAEYIMITPGQTIDVLLHANQAPGRHYMAAHVFSDARNVSFDNTTTTAIVEYLNCNISEHAPPLPYLPPFNDTLAAFNFSTHFKSLASEAHPVNVPRTIDRHLLYTISVNLLPCPANTCQGPNGSRLLASVNNQSFVSPVIDILEAYYYKIKGIYKTHFPPFPPHLFNFTADTFPLYLEIPTPGTRIRVLNYNESIELVFQGTNLVAGENHPMHLHGHGFYVVGRGFGNYNPITDPLTYNLEDPPMENTVGVPRNGWTAIRFRANNPGVWFLHCHLERHLTWGMDNVFITRDGPGPNEQILPPPPDMPKCL